MLKNDARTRRVNIFEDTMHICKDEKLAKSIRKTIEDTIIYDEKNYPSVENRGFDTIVSVTRERSLECAQNFHQKYLERKIGVHNFASATNPGGGVVNGSSAQEEAICRCSTLYPCLNTERNLSEFYQMHRKKKDLRYTDYCIYTPNITVIKSDTAYPELLPESQWFHVDMLTCAAPNLREKPYNAMNPGCVNPVKVSDEELLQIHKKRAKHLLTIAAANGIEILILGAFGCGAFRNDPSIVARAYNEVISEFKGCFREICFAVYCNPNDLKNYDIFKRVVHS